jgi:hypothetical protein
MKSYNKVDCTGLWVRVCGKPARYFRFKTLQRREDVTALKQRIQRRYDVGFMYATVKSGRIF